MTSSVTILGIAGPSAAGKSTLASMIAKQRGRAGTTIISLDWYYRDLAHLTEEQRRCYIFDHPDAIDAELLSRHLEQLGAGEEVVAPGYDFSSHARVAGVRVEPQPLVVAEGFLLLCFESVRRCLDASVFVNLSREARLGRRMHRDIAERGRSRESVARQFEAEVIPGEDRFVLPSARYADLIVRNDGGPADLLARVCGHDWSPGLSSLLGESAIPTTAVENTPDGESSEVVVNCLL